MTVLRAVIKSFHVGRCRLVIETGIMYHLSAGKEKLGNDVTSWENQDQLVYYWPPGGIFQGIMLFNRILVRNSIAFLNCLIYTINCLFTAVTVENTSKMCQYRLNHGIPHSILLLLEIR